MLYSVRKRLDALLDKFGHRPPIGRVRFGSFRRLHPVSRKFGYDRGTPIDRYYVEGFLKAHAGDIRAHVLEILDPGYTRKFGGDRVTKVDVLDLNPRNPRATIIANLTDAAQVPSEQFDCIICTQTLQMIYEVRAAVSNLHRMLKPGGVLLVTAHGLSMLDQGECYCEQWRFTAASARRLFGEFFSKEDLDVRSHGNVFAAVAFLEGLALEKVRAPDLDYHDELYELLITVRAVKSRSGELVESGAG